ncbi:MAG: UDP-glucose 4-epimerase GalE [Xanthomonadales bacterium]|nr:UDP-glucose 4-epimerase GalE [Xanthomonadales bacterium]
MKTSILVTGGTGFIGSHTCVALLEAGHDVVVLDNLCNSNVTVIKRIGRICDREPVFVEGDIRDGALLKRLFNEHPITAVMHFAGLKAVGESMHQPLSYYENNISGTVSLLMAMGHAGIRTMVFSSSATVYGNPASVPITEEFPRSTTNPYGATKLVIEDMLADLFWAEPNWRLARLRYFNPVGAHESGLIGENPRGVPNNLMPFIAQTAAGLRDELTVFGDNYDTPDGTGVRDYIHVVDLANGHVAALDYLQNKRDILTVNLGTGQGVSVLEMIRAFEETNQCKVPYRISERRVGDIAECWADTSLANRLLGWRANRTLENMCADSWRWQNSLQDKTQ